MKEGSGIKSGSVLLSETPFVYSLSSKFRIECCDFCFKRGEHQKCSNCHYVYYCDKDCQKQGWPVHKLECKYLKKVAPRIIPDAARLLAKLIQKLNRGGNSTKSYYSDVKFRTFKDLMSHYPNLKQDQRRLEHLYSISQVLHEYLVDEIIPNSTELMGIFGRMCINSFNICNQEMQSVGTGIYLAASILDHSCTPNAIAIFEGTTINIRALEDMPKLNWSKVFISYIDILNSTKSRREELETLYYFTCNCPKCSSPEPLCEMFGMCCPNTDCDSPVGDKLEKCSKCDTSISESFKGQYKEVLDFTESQLEAMKCNTFWDACNICLNKQKGLFHKYHIKHVKMLDLAFESSIEIGKFDEAKTFGRQLIDPFYKYYGKMHPLTGLLHLKLGKICQLYPDEMKSSLEHLKNAFEILSITHGKTSTIFEEELLPLLAQTSFTIK